MVNQQKIYCNFEAVLKNGENGKCNCRRAINNLTDVRQFMGNEKNMTEQAQTGLLTIIET